MKTKEGYKHITDNDIKEIEEMARDAFLKVVEGEEFYINVEDLRNKVVDYAVQLLEKKLQEQREEIVEEVKGLIDTLPEEFRENTKSELSAAGADLALKVLLKKLTK